MAKQPRQELQFDDESDEQDVAEQLAAGSTADQEGKPLGERHADFEALEGSQAGDWDPP